MCKTNVFYEIVWKYSLTQKALRQAQRLREIAMVLQINQKKKKTW